ncbi:MAG: hypothetical protein PVS3B3_34260 [Ktedonobacteraceae bacterium]
MAARALLADQKERRRSLCYSPNYLWGKMWIAFADWPQQKGRNSLQKRLYLFSIILPLSWGPTPISFSLSKAKSNPTKKALVVWEEPHYTQGNEINKRHSP